MLNLSDKAKAVSALQLEYDELLAKSSAVTEDQFVLAASFRNKMQALGLQQRKILDKMLVLEDAMQKLLTKES